MSQNIPVAGHLCPGCASEIRPRRVAASEEGIDADDPTIGPSRPQDEAVEDEDARAEGLAPATGGLHARVHDDAEEAELRASEGRSRAPDRWVGGQRLHPGCRS